MPTGSPCSIALDPPAERVGRVAADPGQLQRSGVRPRAVVVAVGQDHGPVGDGRVQLLAGGDPAREVAHRPAAAQDPLAVGVGCGVLADAPQVLLRPAALREVAERALVSAHRQVAVRVLEAGQHHAALDVDDPRARPGQLRDLRGAADGDDAAVRDRHRLVHAAGSVDRVDDAVREDQVGRHQAAGRRGTSTLRRNSQTTSPRWLVPIDLHRDHPAVGLALATRRRPAPSSARRWCRRGRSAWRASATRPRGWRWPCRRRRGRSCPAPASRPGCRPPRSGRTASRSRRSGRRCAAGGGSS